VFAEAGKRQALAGAEHDLGSARPGGVGVGVGVGVGGESESVEDSELSPKAAQDSFLDAVVTRVVKRAVKDAKKDKPPPNPRHAPLVARLDAAARRVLGSYAFTPRDAKAASELLHKGTDEEIEARLVKAFAAGGYPSVRTIHELNAHWNHFAVEKPQAFKRENRGPIDAATQKHDPNGGVIDF
ncbi:MAG: hypothetical protein NTV51_00300, partial [Verrucomicrobia bacterium]|nr:hypothetical protein [Verrucomicrobiota bacterium]